MCRPICHKLALRPSFPKSDRVWSGGSEKYTVVLLIIWTFWSHAQFVWTPLIGPCIFRSFILRFTLRPVRPGLKTPFLATFENQYAGSVWRVARTWFEVRWLALTQETFLRAPTWALNPLKFFPQALKGTFYSIFSPNRPKSIEYSEMKTNLKFWIFSSQTWFFVKKFWKHLGCLSDEYNQYLEVFELIWRHKSMLDGFRTFSQRIIFGMKNSKF